MAVDPNLFRMMHKGVRGLLQAAAAFFALMIPAYAAGDHPVIPNFIDLIIKALGDTPLSKFLYQWENIIFSALVISFLALVGWKFGRNPKLIPGQGQNIVEVFVQFLDDLVKGVVGGSHWRKHTPIVGTMFLYIWFMNLSILVPGLKSPTAYIDTTLGLALVVFLYVQYIAISEQGVVHYLDHLAGEPRDLVGWIMVIIMLPLHLLGEIIKPISLSLRLCFNIFAEDVLLAVILGLGILLAGVMHMPWFLPMPIQVLIVPLIIIFSTVQALVFSLLTAVYISLASAAEHH